MFNFHPDRAYWYKMLFLGRAKAMRIQRWWKRDMSFFNVRFWIKIKNEMIDKAVESFSGSSSRAELNDLLLSIYCHIVRFQGLRKRCAAREVREIEYNLKLAIDRIEPPPCEHVEQGQNEESETLVTEAPDSYALEAAEKVKFQTDHIFRCIALLIKSEKRCSGFDSAGTWLEAYATKLLPTLPKLFDDSNIDNTVFEARMNEFSCCQEDSIPDGKVLFNPKLGGLRPNHEKFILRSDDPISKYQTLASLKKTAKSGKLVVESTDQVTENPELEDPSKTDGDAVEPTENATKPQTATSFGKDRENSFKVVAAGSRKERLLYIRSKASFMKKFEVLFIELKKECALRRHSSEGWE